MKSRKSGAKSRRISYYHLYLVCLVIVIATVFVFLLLNRGSKPRFAVVADCTGQKANDFGCWRDRYKQLVIQQSPKVALSDARAKAETNTFIKQNCHEIAHLIGRTAGKKYPDISEAYSLGDDFCASGYYHGVMQALVDTVGKDKIIGRISTICAPLAQKKQYGLPHYNCVHGLGHGLMSVEGNQLFNALHNCDGLNDDWEQNSCYSGVFMENIMSEFEANSYSAYLKKDDPLYPCTAVDDKYKKMCYYLQTDHALIVEKADFSKVFQLCASLGNEDYTNMCYRSLGRNSSSYASYDISRTIENCSHGATLEAQKSCFIAAATDYAWHFQDDKKALQLCSAVGDTNISTGCTQAVGAFTYKAT